VLPGAILYDLVLTPFVLWVVSAAVRRPGPERAPEPVFSQTQRLAGAMRAASVGAVPGLRLTGSTPHSVPLPVRSEPKLRLGATRSPALSRTIAASSLAPPPVAGGRAGRLNFTSAGRGNSLGGAASALRVPQGLPAKSPGKGWLRAERLAGAAAPRFKSPGKGWLRTERPAGAAAPKFRSPGKGWLRPAKPMAAPRRKSPGRGWLRPAKPVRSNWYTGSRSGRWLRRRKNPWRSRTQRLLQLVGGRR
jgi:hypothetical protein